jgi:hypothetical protein
VLSVVVLSGFGASSPRRASHGRASALSSYRERTCLFSGNSVPLWYMHVQRTTSAVTVLTWFPIRSRISCPTPTRLSSQISGTSSGSTQHPPVAIRIRGAVQTVPRELHPGQLIVRAWRWRNSCVSSANLKVRIGWPISPLTSRLRETPSCLSRRKKSTLTAETTKLPRCDPPQLRLVLGEAGGLTGGGVALNAQFVSSASPACVIDRGVIYRLQRRERGRWETLRGVRGNPRRAYAHDVLTKGTAGADPFYWGWMNWCGAVRGRSYRAVATSGPVRAVEPLHLIPSCLDRSSPSALGST